MTQPIKSAVQLMSLLSGFETRDILPKVETGCCTGGSRRPRIEDAHLQVQNAPIASGIRPNRNVLGLHFHRIQLPRAWSEYSHSVNALPQHSGSVDKDTFFNVVTTEWEEIKSIFRWN